MLRADHPPASGSDGGDMAPDAVAQIRSFNRTVAERVGALQEAYLARGRPLGASRVLWEIGDGEDVRALRARLGVDSGYLSRLLRGLEAEGLVEVGVNREDRRVRFVSLTAKGRSERVLLDRRSADLAETILEPLSPKQRERLVEAMAEVERLLTASAVEVRLVDPAEPDAQHCLRRYFDELLDRAASGAEYFEDALRGDEMREPEGAFVVAYLHGEAIGCCGMRTLGEAMAEVKRMWVDPRARGLGLGRRLLEHIEGLARERDVRALRLDTNEHLTEAITMYRSAGYLDIPRYSPPSFATHWFEKAL